MTSDGQYGGLEVSPEGVVAEPWVLDCGGLVGTRLALAARAASARCRVCDASGTRAAHR